MDQITQAGGASATPNTSAVDTIAADQARAAAAEQARLAAEQATQMQAILHWLRTTQMPERPWELRLFANYLAETGRAVMATVWRQR
mgnify:CR=1 FL=1